MKILSTSLMIIALSAPINAMNKDKMVKEQCKDITNDSKPMVENTYLKGIVEGIHYATPYGDTTELAKSSTTKSIMEQACKNIFENRTLHGYDADYKWQVMKLTSKKHSKMKQQF